jgi:hypothetical protein
MSFGQLKTMGGNFVSRLGGFGDDPNELLTQQQIQQLTPEQLTTYNQQRSMAQQQGMRELAARLSDAFAGRDIVSRARVRRSDLLERQKEAQDLQRNTQIQEAIAAGNLDKAMSLVAIDNPAVALQYAQTGRVTEEDLMPKVSADGTTTTFFDRDEATGVITPRVVVNKEVVEQLAEAARIEKAAQPLPASAFEKEADNLSTIEAFEEQNNIIDSFIEAAENDLLQFGLGEELQDFFGNLGLAGKGQDGKSQERLFNKNRFERWKQSYVNTVLQAAKGPQTDGDANRALEQLQSAKTPEAVVALLKDIKAANNREIQTNKTIVNSRRENYGKPDLYTSTDNDTTKVKFKRVGEDGS